MSESEPVVVVATIQVKPGAEEQALAAFTESISATHGEPGCVGYALHRDLEDPNRFVIVEQWASDDALQEHAQTPHLKQLFATMGDLVAAPPTILRTTPVPVGDAGKGVL